MKKCAKFFRRYINGTKGVISLFLAILMIPFVSIAAALLNLARINSAVAIFDEALCNASNSTLGTYDAFLKKRFGLLAIAQSSDDPNKEGYSAQELIQETFQFYMEQNLGVLNNTYVSTETTAAGVYPLTNTDVLLSEVMECSKYTIPVELLVDGLSLEDLLSSLLKSLNPLAHILDAVGARINLESKFMRSQLDMEALVESLEKCEEEEKKYPEFYKKFSTAVNTYNETVDEMKEKVAQCEAAVTQCEEAVEAAEADLAAAQAAASAAVEASGQETEEGTEEGTAEESTSTSIGDDEVSSAQTRLEEAERELEEAKEELAQTIDEYHNRLIPQREQAKSTKSDYVTFLEEFADILERVGDDAEKASKTVGETIKAGGDLVGAVADVVYDEQKEIIDQNTEALGKYKENSNNDETARHWENQIRQNEEAKNKLNNNKTILKAAAKGSSKAVSEIKKFVGEKHKKNFYDLAEKIRELAEQVEALEIPEEDEHINDVSNLYIDLTMPLTSEGTRNLLKNLADEIKNSSFWKIVEAMRGFFEALFKIEFLYDSKLKAKVEVSSYYPVGGLPSRKSYSVSSEFQEEDKAQSEYYKSIMGAYTSSSFSTDSVSSFEATMTAIKRDMDTIKGLEWDWLHVFSSLGELVGTIISLGGHLMDLLGEMVQIITSSAVYEKVLLAGYIGYNTSNRTTYKGSPLTGGSYHLAQDESDAQRAFYGAETEYIICGALNAGADQLNEQWNQITVFYIIYVIRALINIPTIILNGEVTELAASVGAGTFGIGTLVVYVLYFLLEPLMDTLILVNGEDIPIFKSVVYLTPSGIMDLVGKFYKLNLSGDQKQEIYRETITLTGATEPNKSFPLSYTDFEESGKKENKADFLTIDYTKTLILIMLFLDTDSMLKRLGDIIQMESTLEHAAFSLEKSFTYLRASGSFSTNVFIRLSGDKDELNSNKRVVYRGY